MNDIDVFVIAGGKCGSSTLKKTFLNLIHNSGHPGIKLEKKIDFDKLYNEKFN